VTIKVKIDMPVLQRLDIDGDRVVKKTANWLAARMRTRLRRGGKDADGKPIKPAKSNPAGKGLKRTGELARSVKASRVKRGKGRSRITARGIRSDGQSNEVVLADNQIRLGSQPILGVDDKTQTRGVAVTRKEVGRQLKRSPRGGFVTKVKRLR